MSESENYGPPILEVIVSSLSDAIEAEQGGASRLEIVRDLERGGLTPDLSMVRAIAQAVSLPLRVILRENEDDSACGDDAQLRATAIELQQIHVDGLVIGFLRNGSVDLERTLSILEVVPELGATFHHAFDEDASPFDTIARFKQCGRIDRILSSGGPGELPVRAARLEGYCQHAGEEIAMLAGGGLDEESIRFLRARTEVREFHVGRAVRSCHRNGGVVRADFVRRLRELLLCEGSPMVEFSGCKGRANE